MDRQEDVVNTELTLGLGVGGGNLQSSRMDMMAHSSGQRKKSEQMFSCLKPGFTLRFPDDVPSGVDSASRVVVPAKTTSSPPNSTISSFSSACVREEGEVEKRTLRVSEELEEEGSGGGGGGGARKKLRLTKEQSVLLEERFREHSTLNPTQKLGLAQQLKLQPRQVEVWFQNRRARTKLKQTEVDREYLKRRCESLAVENERLQHELQELRAAAAAAGRNLAAPPPGTSMTPSSALPLYMQYTGTGLNICPSCESAAAAAAGSKFPMVDTVAVPNKPHFLCPFTHPTTC